MHEDIRNFKPDHTPYLVEAVDSVYPVRAFARREHALKWANEMLEKDCEVRMWKIQRVLWEEY